MEDKKKTNEKNGKEEVELGHLFTLIGLGFSNLFTSISKLIAVIFNLLITVILFILSNFKIIAIGAFIGAVIGGIYHYGYKSKTYESSMTVQPNFGSAVQLYKNIDFYQSLVKQNEVERLANSLNINIEEAFQISGISATPYSNENQIILSYKNFIENLDTTTVKLIDYKTFSNAQPVESFRYHVVTVSSKDKFIFNKLENPIINSIIRNVYYDKIKTTSYKNMTSRKDALEGSMIELDSLRSLYKRILTAESKKENSGTNIFMSNSGPNNKEIVVFDKYMIMNQELIDVNKKLTEENEVINVISSFNPIGKKIGGWYRNNTVIGFVFGFLLVVFLLSLKEINNFLKTYEKN